MKYSPTAKPSSRSSEGEAGSGAPIYIWDLDPELTRQLLATLCPEPGTCRPMPSEHDWSGMGLAEKPRVILAAADPEALPWESIVRLREECGARLLLVLPRCDAPLWWRMTRRGFVNVLCPPFIGVDLDLEFADWGRRAPLAQRLPDLERRMRSRLEFRFPADLKYVSPAAGFIARIAREHGFHPRVWSENLPLALGEALTNAVEHGCQGDSSREVLVEIRIEHEVLKVRIEDEGAGFDCEGVADPHAAEGLIRGSGRGLLLMSALVDRVVYEKGGRVVLLYARRLPPEDEI